MIVLFVLRRLAFGRIQGLIDQRRDRIREALDEADKARAGGARAARADAAGARGGEAERERILEETRRQAQAQFEQARERGRRGPPAAPRGEPAGDRGGEPQLREQIRRDVVELTLLAAEKVTGKTLDADDQRRLIDETIEELDVKRLASEN